MQIKRYLFTGESRLRTPLRLLIAGISLLLTLFLGRVALQQFDLPRSGVLRLAVSQSTIAVIACGVLWVIIRYVDQRNPSEYGLVPLTTQWLKECMVGIFVAGGLIVAIAGAGLWIDAVQIMGVLSTQPESRFITARSSETMISIFSKLLAILTFVIAVAVAEEVMIRGYLLPNVESGLTALSDRYATPGAVIITSGLFALLHIQNPNASLLSTFNTFLAGVWFATAYVFTRRIGLAVGLHFGWNLVLGAGVGLPVSGFFFPITVIDLGINTPSVFLGDSYGPEAGLFVSLGVVIGIIITSRYRKCPDVNIE